MTLTADLQDSIDLARGEKRVSEILHPPTTADALNIAQLHQTKPRKPRSDKGVPKAKPSLGNLIEIKLHVSVENAREIADLLGACDRFTGFVATIQDQVIEGLQKRIEALEK